jgi:uncharacterized protein YdhG (YjbR/CyaY superfamily)
MGDMTGPTDIRDVEAFLAGVPEPERGALERLRAQVRDLVPDADEGIAYGLPCFRLGGRAFLGYGPRQGGCSLYPMSGALPARFADRLPGFGGTKGSIHFTADRPVPPDVLADLVRVRLGMLRETGH